MKFHHIGIACDNIEEAQEYVKALFDVKEVQEKIYDPLQEAYLCMMTTTDHLRIELIQGKPVLRLVKRGQYLYHTCYEVSDLDAMIEKLCQMGSIVVSEAKEAVLFDNRRVAFLSSQLGLIELLEVKV